MTDKSKDDGTQELDDNALDGGKTTHDKTIPADTDKEIEEALKGLESAGIQVGPSDQTPQGAGCFHEDGSITRDCAIA